MNDPKLKWVKPNALDVSHGNSTPPSYPNEAMVKIFSSGSYSDLFTPLLVGQRVVDVGCGFGNNMTFFLDRGLEAIGVEVTDDMMELASDNLRRLGYGHVDIVRGENERIPFPNGHFDVLISTGAIHYSQGEEALERTFAEFGRVTKAGGRIFISTVGPDHEMRMKATRGGRFLWQVLDYGFRSGDMFAFFDDRAHLERVARRFFSRVETGIVTEHYATRTLQFLYAFCVK